MILCRVREGKADTYHAARDTSAKERKKSRWRWASRWKAELPSEVASHDARCQLQVESKELNIVLASSRVECDGKVEKETVFCSRWLQSVKAGSRITLLGRDADGIGTTSGAQGAFDANEPMLVIGGRIMRC